jgi:fructose-1,6-bisphosphatase/inositol monophosphatase family enzyme
MVQTYGFGELNGHSIGIIIKELMRRAIAKIRSVMRDFEVHEKDNYLSEKGTGGDMFTTADTAAQEIFLRGIKECFPGFGIIAEEDHLKVEPDGDYAGLYFTIDPLDGTKAFVRRQSHGVGSMLSLVDHYQDEVLAAVVGDVMTQECYYYRPDSESVWRITDYDHCEKLGINTSKPLRDQYVILRFLPEIHEDSEEIRKLINPHNGYFKGYEIESGSIGITMARLWKQEVAAVVLPPFPETPWDSCPVLGISQKLGFVYADQLGNVHQTFVLPKEIERREEYRIFFHRDYIPEIIFS